MNKQPKMKQGIFAANLREENGEVVADLVKEQPKQNTPTEENFDPYCKKCGGCGYIGCCGIRNFIEKHVRGKTDCANEDVFLSEIIDTIEDTDDYKLNHE